MVPTIVGALREAARLNGDPSACNVVVEIGFTWSRIWRRGLAVIDRKFVLEIVQDRDPMIVRAGRQRRDFTIEPCLARVTRSGRLRWLAAAEARRLGLTDDD
jgi:hypothetical protein